jgi:pSer/pThr/pTyr-binding forkhead associated (FHA) protein
MPEEPIAETQRNVLAWLEGLAPDQGRYPITKPAIRIGRKSDNDIVLRNDTVSGYHADIYLNGSQFMISDLDSANQVYVGGRRVEKAFLQDGDIIELGEARFRFLEHR